MRISNEGWKEAGRELPNTVGKTSLFTKAIIEKYGQGDNYVFDPAMMVYLVMSEPQPEEEKKSPSEERAKEYVIREKEVLKLVTQQEKSKEFLTRLTRTSMIPGGRELLKRKSFKQQFTIWVQTFIRDYQDYVQNIFPNTNTIYEAKAEIQKELAVLTETLELWKQATSLKEDSYQKEIEKHVQKIRQERENLEKQEYMQKVQRIILQEMENIDTILYSGEEGKELSELELNFLVKSSIMELEEEERRELYRELVDIKNVREEQHELNEKQINKTINQEEEKKLHKLQTTGSNVRKYLEKLQSVYLEEILLKTLNRKEERSSLEETNLSQNRILTLKEWESKNIFNVEESVVQGEKTGRELHHLVRNRLTEMSEEERQALYRELVNIKNIREERRELYEKQVSRIVSRKEEEEVLQELQTIHEKEWEYRESVQSTYLESAELKESLTEKLEDELFKTLVKRKKETRLEEENQSQSRILTLEEWERENTLSIEESLVQEETTNQERYRLMNDSLIELSEEEKVLRKLQTIREEELEHLKRAQTVYLENVEKKEDFIVRLKEELFKTLVRKKEENSSEEEVLSQNRILTLEEWERENILCMEKSVVWDETIEQKQHRLMRNSLMEWSEEERQELYRELVDIKGFREKWHELNEKQQNEIISQEEKILKKLQSVYIENSLLETLERKRKKDASEEVQLSQNRILSFEEWEREITHRVEENVVQEEETERLEKTERTENAEHELYRFIRNSLTELSEEERQELYQELVNVKEARRERLELYEKQSNKMGAQKEEKILTKLKRVYLEEILLKTLERKGEISTSEEMQLSQNRILSFEEWEREIIHRAEENVVQEKNTESIEKTERFEKAEQELHRFIRNSLTELTENERQELYRELVNRKEARRKQRELYEKQSNKMVTQKEEEILTKLKHAYLEEVLLKTLERKGKISTSEEVQLSQNSILSFDEWEREIIHRTEENVVQEEKTERTEKTEHELQHLVRNSLTELSEEERQELYRELVNRKEVRKEQRKQQEKLVDRVIIQEENKVLQKVLMTFLEELEKKESAVQTERTEKALHLLVRSSLMEMSKEERQDFYRKLITIETAEEIEQVISHRIGMTQTQEQTLIRELQTVFLEEVKKKEILVEMPENQRSYMQASMQFSNQEQSQTLNLERELIQNEENQTVQSETKNIERFYYNSNHMESIERIRMEQKEQFLNLQEISRQQGEQLEKMEIQQKELREKLEKTKQNPYEQEQKVMQKLENQLRLEQLRRGLA